jgi:hypothetical protein
MNEEEIKKQTQETAAKLFSKGASPSSAVVKFQRRDIK